MKEKLKNIGCCLLLIPFLPLFILTIMIVILYDFIATPFRKAKYKKSHFYRDFGEKYNSDFYGSEAYEIYNAVKYADLPIVATLYRNEKGEVSDVLFTFRDILLYISPVWFIDYDKEKDKWSCEMENEETDVSETVDFNEYIANANCNSKLRKNYDEKNIYYADYLHCSSVRRLFHFFQLYRR